MIAMLACQRQLADVVEGLSSPLYESSSYRFDTVYVGISEGDGIKMLFCKRTSFSPLSRAGKAACSVTRLELIAIRMGPMVELITHCCCPLMTPQRFRRCSL